MNRARRYEGVTKAGLGEPYVEYRCGRGNPRFVVQKAKGGLRVWWYLYKVWPGRFGLVETLDVGCKKRLVAEARSLAQNFRLEVA